MKGKSLENQDQVWDAGMWVGKWKWAWNVKIFVWHINAQQKASTMGESINKQEDKTTCSTDITAEVISAGMIIYRNKVGTVTELKTIHGSNSMDSHLLGLLYLFPRLNVQSAAI